mgnify:CR=1 FL=1
MPEFSLKIVNEKGLHARASAKLVEVVEAFDARAEVSKDGMSASGDSIMGSGVKDSARVFPTKPLDQRGLRGSSFCYRQ